MGVNAIFYLLRRCKKHVDGFLLRAFLPTFVPNVLRVKGTTGWEVGKCHKILRCLQKRFKSRIVQQDSSPAYLFLFFLIFLFWLRFVSISTLTFNEFFSAISVVICGITRHKLMRSSYMSRKLFRNRKNTSFGFMVDPYFSSRPENVFYSKWRLTLSDVFLCWLKVYETLTVRHRPR